MSATNNNIGESMDKISDREAAALILYSFLGDEKTYKINPFKLFSDCLKIINRMVDDGIISNERANSVCDSIRDIIALSVIEADVPQQH